MKKRNFGFHFFSFYIKLGGAISWQQKPWILKLAPKEQLSSPAMRSPRMGSSLMPLDNLPSILKIYIEKTRKE